MNDTFYVWLTVVAIIALVVGLFLADRLARHVIGVVRHWLVEVLVEAHVRAEVELDEDHPDFDAWLQELVAEDNEES